MKKFLSTLLTGALLCASALFAAEDSVSTPKALIANRQNGFKVGVVNFKRVVEESKYGKQEQANFEALKKQMEAVLEEREKALNEISAKFNDPDYIDSLSPEAENELKHKFRMMNQEAGQIQGQYYQTLNQANVKILQNLNDMVVEVCKSLAKDYQLEMILNDDGAYYYSPELDVSKQVVTLLDARYDTEAKSGKNSAPGA